MEGNYIQSKLKQNNIYVTKVTENVINEIEKIRIEIYNGNLRLQKKISDKNLPKVNLI